MQRGESKEKVAEEIELPDLTELRGNRAQLVWKELDALDMIFEEMRRPKQLYYDAEFRQNEKNVAQLGKHLFQIMRGIIATCVDYGIEFEPDVIQEFHKGDMDALQRLRAKVLDLVPERETVKHTRHVTSYPMKSGYVP